jgi:hypothetical protein
MTTIDVRPAGPAADLGADRAAALAAEVAQLREQLAEKDREIVELNGELRTMQRSVDDLLDRESMHVYDPDMERLATPAALDRLGTPKPRHVPDDRGTAPHQGGHFWSRPFTTGGATDAAVAPQVPGLEATVASVPELEFEWEGFDR